MYSALQCNTQVTSVSPTVGGAAGGTHITITGNSFDSYPGKTKVRCCYCPSPYDIYFWNHKCD